MADKNIEVMLKDVRLSFVNVFTPQEFVDDKTGAKRWVYNLNALVPKKLPDGSDNPQIKVLGQAMKDALAASWGDSPPKIPPERRCVRDGEPIDPDTVDPDVPGSGDREALYDGYAGCFFVSANRPAGEPDENGKFPPNPVQLLDSRKGPDGKFPRLKAGDGKLYSGCYADVIIRIYGFDGTKKKVPNRINASLEAVKFKRHGEAFGAAAIDADSRFDEEDADDGFDEPTTSTKTPAPESDDLLG